MNTLDFARSASSLGHLFIVEAREGVVLPRALRTHGLSSFLLMEAREGKSYCITFPVMLSVLRNLIPTG